MSSVTLQRYRFLPFLLTMMTTACSPTPALPPSLMATPSPTAAFSVPASKSFADVEFVKAVQSTDGTWTFQVTVQHPDTGWDDYADGWDVVTPDGRVLKVTPEASFTRLLLHPHVGEQPFTRSQSGIRIPEGVTSVTVRAHSLVRGFGGREITLDITRPKGDHYEVQSVPY
ncbi:MAG: hypothetical protein DSY55_01095 [Clostridia bacterium]|nr:MAG: hypothetical protein DSY55_01095 [Clostridia bacterium]